MRNRLVVLCYSCFDVGTFDELSFSEKQPTDWIVKRTESSANRFARLCSEKRKFR